jgi:hypothetical protein
LIAFPRNGKTRHAFPIKAEEKAEKTAFDVKLEKFDEAAKSRRSKK